MGPLKQIQRMFAPTRAIASIVMLLALILTLVSALHVRSRQNEQYYYHTYPVPSDLMQQMSL